MDRISKRVKKIIAMMLVVVLAFGSLTINKSVKAETANIKISAISDFNTVNKDWRFTIEVEGEWATSGDFDRYMLGNDKNVIIKDDDGYTKDEVTSASVEVYKMGNQMLLCVWGTYTNQNQPKSGDTVTIPAGTMSYEKDGNKQISISVDTILEYNGTNWSILGDSVETQYRKINYTGINAATSYSEGNGWDVYLIPDKELPGTVDATYFSNVKVVIDDTERNITFFKASHEGTTFFRIEKDWLPKDITTDARIVVKAGKYDSPNCSEGIEIASDFTIYANHNGWTTDGFIKDVSYKKISFDGLNSATTYVTGIGWTFYMTPSETLPGTGDVTNFSDVKIEIDGREKNSIIYHASHEGTALLALDGTFLPQNITKDTKVTIKAGKYLSNDGSDGIEITKDYTIYLNQYGVSDSGFNKEVEYEKINFTSVNGATGFTNGNWVVYLQPDKTIPGTGDATRFDNLIVEIDKQEYKLALYKTSYQGTACIGIDKSILPEKITKNTTIVIKKGKLNSNDDSNGVEIVSDFTVYANEYGFSADGYCKAPTYKKVSFGSLNAGTSYFENAGWVIYMNPSTTLPGTADTTFYKNVKIYVNGVEKSVNLYKAEYEKTACLILPEDIIPKDIKGNVKIVLKAGKYDSSDGGEGIEITKDFTIYANQYGISDEGFYKKPSYIKVTFNGIDEATGYLDNANLWGIYLNPTAKLPGKADSTFYKGIKAEINGKKVDITINKAGHNDTAFIAISSTEIPKNIKKNTKLVIKAGKAISNDGSDGINITKDYTIYMNQWGISAKGFLKKPNFKNITFKSLDSASGYSAESGWLLYINPSSKLPGKADSTRFTGLEAAINGKKQSIVIYKASHNDTALAVSGLENLNKNGNNKIIIKAGSALSNDGSDAIKLTKDFTVYANKYGVSTKGYLKKPTLIQKNAKVSLDRDTVFGGDKNGIYLNTNDKFAADDTWQTKINSPEYEKQSGIYYNGKKIEASLVKYAKGKVYVALQDAGIAAKDKDKVVIKGVFANAGKAVSYSGVTFYFNGKTWNTKYEKAKPETYTKIELKDVDSASKYLDDLKAWHVYLQTDKKLPGEGDKINFSTLSVEINGKKTDTVVYHAGYNDDLFFVIDEKVLPANAPDGTAITLKAGKALAGDLTTGIQLTRDYTFYVYKGMLSAEKPTTNTKWRDVKALGLNHSTGFREDANDWLLYLKMNEELKAESGDYWSDLKLKVNGKEITINAQQNEKNMLLITIPASVLPKDSKKATVTIEKGVTAVARAGRYGIKFKEAYTCYMFNGMFSEKEFTEIQKLEAKITGVQTVMGDRDVYIKLNAEFPGTAWFERYPMTCKYNGKEFVTEVCKAESSNNKTIYFRINDADVPEIKEGDILEVSKDTVLECGGYQITILNDFAIKYTDGVWSQYIKTDVKAPKQTQGLWEMARFDKEYIPTATVSENNSVLASNEDEYNTITSTEKLKDFTISFDAKKAYDDEVTPSFSAILRGNAISEEEPMTKSMLYGYVITFSSSEVKGENEDDPSTWTQFIQLWKNGENYALLDQYRVNYTLNTNDHPYFRFGQNFNYRFSVYNITDTCACIEVYVNDKLALRYYDEAGSDIMDPAINEGTFQILVGCPTYFCDDVVELDEVLAEADECEVGDEIRVAATYPSVLEGVTYTVDKDGAEIDKGIFAAEKDGTYTVSASYNGKTLKSKIIKVNKGKAAVTSEENENHGSVLPFVIGGIVIVLIAGGAVAFVLIRKKKRQNVK